MKIQNRFLYMMTLMIISLIVNSIPTKAQIIPDGTLSTQVNPSGKIVEITGGIQAGKNLFHSFKDFSLITGNTAYFNNPVNIENIISRVIGTSISNIDGLIKANGIANLFLLNPNGIIFGNHAQLNIGGSFIASTAQALTFRDGTIFSATDINTTPLLTMSVPIGVQWGTNLPRNITNMANLSAGKDLTLSAGSVNSQGILSTPQGNITVTSVMGDINVKNLTAISATLDAAQNLNLISSQLYTKGDLHLFAGNTIKVRDSLTQPFIAKSANNLLLQGNHNIDIFALNHADSGFFSGGNMVLRSNSTISGDAHYLAEGNFKIENLDHNLGNLNSPEDPIIRALGDVSFNDYTGASLHILAGGSVSIPGVITITNPETSAHAIVENVKLSDGNTLVNINGNTQKTLDIRAGSNAVANPEIIGNLANLLPLPNLNSNATSANINIGKINNNGGMVFLSNQYYPNSSLSTGTIQVNSIDTSSLTNTPGMVVIDSRNSITLNSNINSVATNIGKGGDIHLRAAQGNITTQSINSSGINGGGYITIYANNGEFLINNASIDSSNLGTGTGGNIDISTQSLSLLNGGQISSNTYGLGNAGKINIRTAGTINIDGMATNQKFSSIYSNTEVGAVGTAGEININAGSLIISNGGIIATSTFGKGNAGDINIATNGSIYLQGSVSNNSSKIVSEALKTAIGNAGAINIIADSLAIANGGQLSTNTQVKGNAGNINITTVGNVSIKNKGEIVSQITNNGIGNAGEININAASLNLSNGGLISTGTESTGNAGNIKINATGNVSIDGISNDGFSSIIESEVSSHGIGNGGEIDINAGSINVSNSGMISTTTFGQGDAGKVNINVTGSMNVDNSKIVSAVQNPGVGNAGAIKITADALVIANQGALSANTFWHGNAGDIIITSNTFTVANGGKLETTTGNRGNAGDINIYTRDRVYMTGEKTGLFANTTSTSTGNGGNIYIDPSQVEISNGASITVNSLGGGNGGNIVLQADMLQLNKDGFLSANTANGEGGGITLNISNLALLRHNSLISATAGGTANGGNVTITAPFVVAVSSENSDILASAFKGNGGEININTTGIFGLNYSSILTSNSDINASSQFGVNGTVEINTPGIDPAQGLRNLPSTPVDLSRLITSNCSEKSENAQNTFTITGRGGLPNNPTETLESEIVLADLSTTSKQTHTAQSSNTHYPLSIVVEAQGWTINQKGQIILTAQATNLTPHQPWQKPVSCNHS